MMPRFHTVRSEILHGNVGFLSLCKMALPIISSMRNAILISGAHRVFLDDSGRSLYKSNEKSIERSRVATSSSASNFAG